MAIDWRRRRPILANDVGGLSGPAIKPLALRCVWDIARALPSLPILGIGGIQNADDALEFLVAGATAIQVGTATFADPTAAERILDGLQSRLVDIGAHSPREVVGTLKSNAEARVSTPESVFDVAVLGAGAAGLIAAIRAAERGREVVLLEKNRRPGVKILMSGGTRCNLTNARGLRNVRVVSGPIDPAYDPNQARGARSIQQAFGSAGGAFLGPVLKAFSVEESVTLFEREGVATKVEANGKIFPVNDRATDVLAALMRRLERSGAELRTDCPARAIETVEGGFAVAVPDGTLCVRSVIVSMGGQSYPGCGTTGDGYALARRFGHTIVDPRPALVPVRVPVGWVHEAQWFDASGCTGSGP